MSLQRVSRNRAGFTLVELLIVVAIIGVLATMGVPAYKRMVERAKTKEAQVALGGLYTSELAFQSEYGGYGNNLIGIGFEFEGTGANYVVGFPSNGNCGTAAPTPLATEVSVGAQINASYGQYFNGPNCSVAGRGVVAPVGNAACTAPAGSCGFDNNMFPANGSYFVATATGCIASGCGAASPAAAPTGIVTDVNLLTGDFAAPAPAATVSKKDVWGINQRRKLVRIQAGGSGS